MIEIYLSPSADSFCTDGVDQLTWQQGQLATTLKYPLYQHKGYASSLQRHVLVRNSFCPQIARLQNYCMKFVHHLITNDFILSHRRSEQCRISQCISLIFTVLCFGSKAVNILDAILFLFLNINNKNIFIFLFLIFS